MQAQLGKKNKIKNIKAMSIVEALVATVILGVGIISVLQLAAWVTRSVDVSIEKNKVNYLSEMMMEDMISDKNNLSRYNQLLNCTVPTLPPTGNVYDVRVNHWQKNIKESIDGGLVLLGPNSTRCTTSDFKQIVFIGGSSSIPQNAVRIKFLTNNGNNQKYLGGIIK
jgi:Tfp pilus assembly protein PilV